MGAETRAADIQRPYRSVNLMVGRWRSGRLLCTHPLDYLERLRTMINMLNVLSTDPGRAAVPGGQLSRVVKGVEMDACGA